MVNLFLLLISLFILLFLLLLRQCGQWFRSPLIGYFVYYSGFWNGSLFRFCWNRLLSVLSRFNFVILILLLILLGLGCLFLLRLMSCLCVLFVFLIFVLSFRLLVILILLLFLLLRLFLLFIFILLLRLDFNRWDYLLIFFHIFRNHDVIIVVCVLKLRLLFDLFLVLTVINNDSLFLLLLSFCLYLRISIYSPTALLLHT